MKICVPRILAKIQYHLCDPLFKNSFFILLTFTLSSGFGFIFWVLAAKFYPSEDVGIATALISMIALLTLLSRFGLDFAIIRFFPTHDKSRIFSTSTIITTSFAVVFGMIFIAGVNVFSPELSLLKSPQIAGLFLIFLIANSVTTLTNISFIAVRKAAFQSLQSIVVGSRILFLIPLNTLGAIGIFCAVGISFMLALLTAFALLVQLRIRPELVTDRRFLNEAFHFSAENYFVSLFTTAPNMILPIMVLNVLGADSAAYYYIAFAIASLLFTIPSAISTSLFVEGSHGETMKRTAIKSLFAILAVLLPVATLLFICGGYILGIVSAEYATGGLGVLRMLTVASLFIGVNYVYFAIKRVQKDVKGLVVLSGLIGGLLIGLGYMFMTMFGVVGVGYAWLVGNGIGSVFVGTIIWKEGWIHLTIDSHR